jgi:hypothetical protein
MPERGTNPNVCPYCGTEYAEQAELVEHLTEDGGCPKRKGYTPKHRGRRAS